jgi:ATP-dependent Clp protease ATP-binding subunit ClpA
LIDMEIPIAWRGSLETFTRDLTAAAIRDRLEPVLCRESEIERVVTILMRESKNNPVLVGDAGVGKTAIAEGLAQRISTGKVPYELRGTRVLALSHIDLIAGTSFRGQYEKRLQGVIREAGDDPGVILFIDELHNLIGAGTAIGAPMDAANMLKPALASGQLRVIGATTDMEYDRYICGDAALERRFQRVPVSELSREQTLTVLRGRRPRLEMHHLVVITDEALETAVDLSIDFLPDRPQPDRAIDLMDETCAKWRLQKEGEPPEKILELARRRGDLLAFEQDAIERVLALSVSRGNPLERFSYGTFHALEKLGLGVEKLITGRTTARRPLPVPDSVRRLRESDPVGALAAIHCERLRGDDLLRAALSEFGHLIGSSQVQSMLKLNPSH